MKVGNIHYRSIWREGDSVRIIDQTALPRTFATLTLTGVDQTVSAIRTMKLRGAPLIGVAASWPRTAP